MILGPVLALFRAPQTWDCFHHLTIQLLARLLLEEHVMGQDQSLHVLIAVVLISSFWTLQLLLFYEEECASLLSKYDFLSCSIAAKFIPGVRQQVYSTVSSKASVIHTLGPKALCPRDCRKSLCFFCREWLFHSFTCLYGKIVVRVEWDNRC